MSKRIFVSHSSTDREIALKLADALGKDGVWIDYWDLDLGDVLPRDIAEAVENVKWFVLVASRASMRSRWVRYELNLAVLRWIERADCRIAVLIIEDCELHPELAPFLRVDASPDPEAGIAELVGKLAAAAPLPLGAPRDSRLGFVNRYDAIQAVEDLTYRGIRALFVWGIFGVGKTSFARRLSRELFQAPIERFPLSEAHGHLRLSMELCARAGLKFPDSNDPADVLTDHSARAIVELTTNGALVLFDNVESTLSDDASLPPYLSSLTSLVCEEVELPAPLLFCSSRQPDLESLPAECQGASHSMRLDGLSDDHVVFCLENWLRLTQPETDLPSRAKLADLAKHLHGYPLGAQLAALSVSRSSVDALLDEPWRIKDLRVGIAKRLLGTARRELNPLELQCLEVLAVDESGATTRELVEVLERDVPEVSDALEGLSRSLLVVPEGGLLTLHPLVREHFWTRAFQSGSWQHYASALGGIARRRTEELEIGTEAMVRQCARAFRLLTLSGRREEAASLVYSFQEELRGVIQRLYHARENDLAMQYVELWLSANPKDHKIRWYKSRLHTRLGQFDDALAELRLLEDARYSPYMVHHALGLLARDRREYREALGHFSKGLSHRRNYIPLLRDSGDMCLRLGLVPEALDVLQEANDLSPHDPYVVPLLVEALLENNDDEEAVRVLQEALQAQPEEASLHHRLSTLHEKLENNSFALQEARAAVRLAPDSLPEAHLNLAALELRVGSGAGAAEEVLSSMPRLHSERGKQVKATLLARVALEHGDTQKARREIRGLDPLGDSYTAHLKLQIEIRELIEAAGGSSKKNLAARHRVALATAETVSSRFQGNAEIRKALERLKEVERQLDLGD